MMSYYNDHPLSSEGGKSPKQLRTINSLRYQVTNTLIDPRAVDILRGWQNLPVGPTEKNVFFTNA